MNAQSEQAVLGGGCFWCLEAVFEQLKGVEKVESGYAGGEVPYPTYEQVCSGTTGHAEVVRISFDPQVISFGDLLDIFFAMHDPTTLNRQGADVGTQYRSAIFYYSDEQKKQAEQKIQEWNAGGAWDRPIVTQLAPLTTFFPAEDYHQGYFRGNPRQGYCQAVIVPKVVKLRKKFAERLKA
jgi:peptide-methionine (S)-S-oxide reductase